MKTKKILATTTILISVMLITAALMANVYNKQTGDGVITSEKNKVTAAKSPVAEMASPVTSGSDFNYLRFDVSCYVETDGTGSTELPTVNMFDRLRFDVNNYSENDDSDLSEMPVSEFDHLRFDVNKFSDTESVKIGELPASE